MTKTLYPFLGNWRFFWRFFIHDRVLGELSRLVADEEDEAERSDDQQGCMHEEDDAPLGRRVRLGNEQRVEAGLDEQRQALDELNRRKHKVIVLSEHVIRQRSYNLCIVLILYDMRMAYRISSRQRLVQAPRPDRLTPYDNLKNRITRASIGDKTGLLIRRLG